MIHPDFRGPNAFYIGVTPRGKLHPHRRNSKVTTTFTNRSRTRQANLARRTPTQAELKRRALTGVW